MTLRKAVNGSFLSAGVALCFCAAMATGAVAQTAPAASAAKHATATGCVSTASDGSLQLKTDTSTYILSPASADVDLNAQVGHTVTVTGTSAAAPAGSPEGAPTQFTVSEVKMVKDSCGQ